jgi:hypothetical protein
MIWRSERKVCSSSSSSKHWAATRPITIRSETLLTNGSCRIQCKPKGKTNVRFIRRGLLASSADTHSPSL